METLDQVLTFGQGVVARLTKLDPANLVWLLSVVFGYVLKFVSIFPNKFIPAASFVVTLCAYTVMSAEPGQPLKKLATDVVLAILFWGFAWGLHKAILSHWIDKRLFDEEESVDPKEKKMGIKLDEIE